MNIGQIDTRHATANQPNFSNGNCQPYTGVPFGMNYFAPQTTDQNGSWWFHPDDRVFQGYRLTHQPSPWMVISVICCLRRSMENYRRTPFPCSKFLPPRRKYILPDSSVDLSITLWHLFYIDT